MEYRNKLTIFRIIFYLFVVVCALFILISLIKKKPFILNKTKQNLANVVGTVKDVNYKQIVNKEGLKYVLKAKEMKIYKGDIYLFRDVQLRHPTKKYGDILIMAKAARADKERNVQLDGNVTARGKNFTIKTEKANWNSGKNELSGLGKVTFQGEIDLSGVGFKYKRKNDMLYIYHDVDVWIR